MTAGGMDWASVIETLRELRRGAEALTRSAVRKPVTPGERRAIETHREAVAHLVDLVAEKAAKTAGSEASDAALDAALEAAAMEAATARLVEAARGP